MSWNVYVCMVKQSCTDFKRSRSLVINAEPALGSLHRSDLGIVEDVSELYAAPIFRAEDIFTARWTKSRITINVRVL